MKILFVVNHSEFFLSHRLPFALEAQNRGFEVHVATSPSGMEEQYAEHGLNWHELRQMDPGGMNPIMDLKLTFEFYRLYTRIQPDIIHHVTIKPVMYGGIAARRAGVKAVVNALSGLGYLFRSDAMLARLVQAPINMLLKYACNHPNSTLLLQNHDDVALFTKRNVVKKEKTAVIRGSGVDINKFTPGDETENEPPIVLLASRMLWDKGIGEFVEAAKIINKDSKVARFVLAGKPDDNNPKSISGDQLREWNENGVVEWLGFCENMVELFQNSSIVVLPSYYEGVPKVLIEAAACGKPIVATDVPGCREIVRDGTNGYLVKAKNSKDLADKILSLLQNKEERIKMGKESRKIAEEHFSLKMTKERTFDLYKTLLEN